MLYSPDTAIGILLGQVEGKSPTSIYFNFCFKKKAQAATRDGQNPAP